MVNRRKIMQVLPYVCVAIAYLLLAFCIPYCHDDWDWGIDVGMTRWLEAGDNSRYVGNFFVIVMTRSVLVKTAVIFLSMYFIPIVMMRLCDKKDVCSYLLVNLLMLVVPKLMWQQTYGWVSAFANYVIAVLFVLLLVLGLKETQYERKWYGVLLCPLATAVMLFTENVTVCVLAGLGLFFVYESVMQRRVHWLHLSVLIFALLGFAAMFSNEMYGALLDDGVALGGIREMDVDMGDSMVHIVRSMVGKFCTHTLPPLFFCYRWLTLALTGALLWGSAKVARGVGEKIAFWIIAVPMLAVTGAVWIENEWNPNVMALLTIIYYVSVAVMIMVFFEQRRLMMIFWLGAAAVLLPMVMVTVIGPRLYYMSYIVVVAIILMAVPNISVDGRLHTAMYAVMAGALVVTIIFYGQIYVIIYTVAAAQQVAIEAAVASGASSVTLVKERTGYWWGRNPDSEIRMKYYKLFYGIPEEMDVQFVWYE